MGGTRECGLLTPRLFPELLQLLGERALLRPFSVALEVPQAPGRGPSALPRACRELVWGAKVK